MLIAAHGNSIRALVKYLDNLSDTEIMELNIPTGSWLNVANNAHSQARSDSDSQTSWMLELNAPV